MPPYCHLSEGRGHVSVRHFCISSVYNDVRESVSLLISVGLQKNERKMPQDHFPARFITHAWGCSPIIHVSVWGTRWPASDNNAGWASIRRRPHAASKVSRPLKKISKSRLDLWTDTDPSTLLFAIFPFWHLTLSDTIILLSFSTWKAQGKPRNYQILIFEMDFQRYVRY